MFLAIDNRLVCLVLGSNLEITRVEVVIAKKEFGLLWFPRRNPLGVRRRGPRTREGHGPLLVDGQKFLLLFSSPTQKERDPKRQSEGLLVLSGGSWVLIVRALTSFLSHSRKRVVRKEFLDTNRSRALGAFSTKTLSFGGRRAELQ